MVDATVKVSVVIPTYNRSQYLGRAIQSCLQQSVPVLEIVVVDDGSTDDTSTLVASIQQREPSVKYLRLDQNRGAQAARLEGIRVSGGSWIVFLDSDDQLLMESLSVRFQALNKSKPGIGLIYGDVYFDSVSVDRHTRLTMFDGFSYPALLKELSLCPYSAMMVRRQCFDLVGYPDPAFPAWQDDDMVLTIAQAFPVLHCGAPVAIMHRAPNKISANKRAGAEGCRMIVKKYRRDIVEYHGRVRLLLWHLRVVRSYCVALYEEAASKGSRLRQERFRASLPQVFPSIQLWAASVAVRILDRVLKRHFTRIWA